MRIFKKILIWTMGSVIAILFVLVVASFWLYSTADMKQPDVDIAQQSEFPLYKKDSVRVYGKNTLVLNKNGLWELYVKGKPFERGIAIGRLSEDLLFFQEKVFTDQIKRIIPSDRYLKFLRYFLVIFNRDLGKYVPEDNRKEIYGISLSCSRDFDAIGSPYERQLNYHAAHDIGHVMQGYMLVGCSSFGVWGKESADSSLVVGRNFDFYVGDDFAKNKVIAFYNPDKGYKFASVCWIGMTGVLSGMNEAGLTVTINASQASLPTRSATPISILARIILQYAATIEEAYKIAEDHQTFVAESLLIGSSKDGRAAIIEKSPHDIALFESSTERVVCTNHYQSSLFADDPKNNENIKTTDSDYRLKRMNQLLDQVGKIDALNAAQVLRDTLGLQNKPIGLTNEKSINQFIAHHSVVFKPSELKMWVSTAPWQMGEYVMYDLKNIFAKMDSEVITTSTVNEEWNLPADGGLASGTFGHVKDFRRLKDEVSAAIKSGAVVSQDTLSALLVSNSEYYYTYELIGDYFLSQNQKDKAVDCWKIALTKEIPRQRGKDNIEKKIRKSR